MSKSIKVMSELVHYLKYAKYIPVEQRREIWVQSCVRNKEMHQNKYPFLKEEIEDAYNHYVIPKKVLPSMRSMQYGGKAIEINNSRIYNCSFTPIDCREAFHETMFLLLSGSGVGYSVQDIHVSKLPRISHPFRRKKYVISDDIIGWSEAIRVLIKAYLGGGFYPEFDYRELRLKGARLKTSGGKAPGPDPLRKCLENIDNLLKNKKNGSKLSSLEAHDIECFIAQAVISGGVRLAAMIAFFDKDDMLMLTCKSNFQLEILDSSFMGNKMYAVHLMDKITEKTYELNLGEEDYAKLCKNKELPWWHFESQRSRANNSAVFLRHSAKRKDFDKFWKVVKNNGTGEPGIFFTNSVDMMSNPCVEASLRSNTFCNLTEINDSDVVSQQELNKRARIGAFLGTMQAGYLDFHYLRDVWQENTEQDSLLGVSLTGMATGCVNSLDYGEAAREAKKINGELSERLGIKPAARVTCIKPAGTTSLIFGCSSGIHAWFSEYYMRRVKISKIDALYDYWIKKMPDYIEDDKFEPDTFAHIKLPMKAPEGSLVSSSETAIEFLNRVKDAFHSWIENGHRRGDNTHNTSATVYIKKDEWADVGKWMWENRNSYNGIAVLPFDDNTYIQAPNEAISKEEYEKLISGVKSIDFSKIIEVDDNTDVAGARACIGDVCEI